MFRYKSNKQAFIIAALVILLCLICLAGATLALFTSNPDNGTIGIVTTTGDVKIDIVDAITGETLVGKTLDFQSSADRQEILFEPGAIFHTQGFKLENKGDIPVKFSLSVSEDEDIDMSEFHKAFEVWISPDPNDPTVGDPIRKFTGTLDAKKVGETVYYLFIKMKETAGNEFQGKKYTGIGVTVYAVQGNAQIKE